MDEDRGGPRRVEAGHAVARGELVEGHRAGGTDRRRRVRPQVGHRPVGAVGAVGEDRPDHREDHVDARPEQTDDQEGAHQVVAREAAQGRHVAQLVQRDGDRGHRELDVDEFEDTEADRAGGLDDPTHHPRRVAQRVIGGRHVLVEHHRAGLRGDQQPGVAGLAAGHQQQRQPHALQQQQALTAGAARDGDDGPGQGHQQRAVAEHHLGADQPPHEPEDEVDADRGGEPDQALPPGEHHHHQRHAGVQHRPRLGGEDHLSRLDGDRTRHAVPARGQLQCDEESEADHTHRGPQHDPWSGPRGGPGAVAYSRKNPRYRRCQFPAAYRGPT